MVQLGAFLDALEVTYAPVHRFLEATLNQVAWAGTVASEPGRVGLAAALGAAERRPHRNP